MTTTILNRDFYTRNACVVARELLGARLVRRIDGQQVAGLIVETEAYTGVNDLASHGRLKRTPRNLPMYEKPGHAYVYLTYGMHWLLNVACEPEGHPAAVLLRAIEPIEGLDVMASRRPNRPAKEWTSGPARLTLAIGVDGKQNRVDMTGQEAGLWIEAGSPVEDAKVSTGPRIGLGKRVPEPWFSMAWRWWISDNPYVSR
ncbi:MAG: DNA-3-methyladenine glycosylase [Chloroflexi bacterium]|nr:DNA-3-methyladenine glycosylase [Chloroflexota bacterium]